MQLNDNQMKLTKKGPRPRIRGKRINAPHIDERATAEGRFRKHMRDFTRQLGCRPTPLQLVMLRELVGHIVRSEAIQAAICRGEKINDEEFTRHSRAISLYLKKLGLNTVHDPGDITDNQPTSLADYIASLGAKERP
jgi:hypothetical protein